MVEVAELIDTSSIAPDLPVIQGINSGGLTAQFLATSLPDSEDTAFLNANGEQDVVKSLNRNPGALNAYKGDESSSTVVFCIQVLNEGNWLELTANLESGRLNEQEKAIAASVLSIGDSAEFHALRIEILGSNGQDYLKSLQRAKASILQMPGIPRGINFEAICWDAISFKVLPNAVEFFLKKVPNSSLQLSMQDMAYISEVEDQCMQIIESKCAEFRARTNTIADDFIPDVSIFLEHHVAGMWEDDRQERIATMGRGLLIEYVHRTQSLFLTGNLPQAIQPAKIYACHDIITSAELKGSINKLAQAQMYQQAQLIKNPRVMSRAYFLANGLDDAGRSWSQAAEVSINIKKTADHYMNRVQKTLGVDTRRPMKEEVNQLAGSSNTLAQQLDAAAGGIVVNQSEYQKEVSYQQLSILLACLRLRANATQMSEWELAPTEDLDHIEIVRYLAHTDGRVSSGGDIIYRTATVLLESYGRGHNVTKFAGKNLPQQMYELIQYHLDGRVRQLTGQIQQFVSNKDLQGVLTSSIVYSLAQRQRVKMEYQMRKARKQTFINANSNLLM